MLLEMTDSHKELFVRKFIANTARYMKYSCDFQRPSPDVQVAVIKNPLNGKEIAFPTSDIPSDPILCQDAIIEKLRSLRGGKRHLQDD